MFKFSEEQAYENLNLIREATYKGVKEWRIKVAEEVWQKLKKSMKIIMKFINYCRDYR